MVSFASSLIFDERLSICFAYDPRDMLRRRLENIEGPEPNVQEGIADKN
jgi:hypothetical protein